MYSISQGCINTNLGQQMLCFFGHLDFFFLASDVQNLTNFILCVRLGGDDKQSIKEINRNSMGGFIICASDCSDSSVGSNN
ncbi:hypothetical protein PS1_019113 [Malus domestica]